VERPFDQGTWVVVGSDNNGYIGQVVATTKGLKSPTKVEILESPWICLEQAVELFSPIRPVQTPDGQVLVKRDPIALPLDWFVHPVPLWIRHTRIIFLEEAHKEDVATYATFVKTVEEQLQRMRAQQVGIQIPGSPMKEIDRVLGGDFRGRRGT
jgi:hypothetical protein